MDRERDKDRGGFMAEPREPVGSWRCWRDTLPVPRKRKNITKQVYLLHRNRNQTELVGCLVG